MACLCVCNFLHDMHGSSGHAGVNARGGLRPISITVVNLYQNRHTTMHEPMSRGRSWGRKLKSRSSCSNTGQRNTRKGVSR